MPSLGSHLACARALADRLGHPGIDADRGAYYLGATAPDIRALLRVDRRRTHFFDLGESAAQDSVARMFEEHPRLGDAAGLDPATRAFVAGYLTHLLMDEHYIQSVYRRFFGEGSALGGDLRANVLDRALQYEMNRRELEDGAALAEIRAAIDATAAAMRVGFIESRNWPQWREFTREITLQRPDWERFPRVMLIHLRRGGFSEDEIERVSRDPAALVREAVGHVGERRVGRYLDEAAELAADRLRAYLPPLP